MGLMILLNLFGSVQICVKIHNIYLFNPVIPSCLPPFFCSGNPYSTRIYRKNAEQTQFTPRQKTGSIMAKLRVAMPPVMPKLRVGMPPVMPKLRVGMPPVMPKLRVAMPPVMPKLRVGMPPKVLD
jgi:hypothetical protein